ncbi:unannotated protein [freshwater metagenome]|uniref:Unannotated protein n=1 Tax=freshwater metagenome TaxID=449393 RepID=A0A6J7ETP2_9ZZZZ
MGEWVGAVGRLSRFPVKSMQGEQVDTVELDQGGVVGDRAYALVETDTGKVLSGKTPRIGSLLLGCRATFVGTPGAGDAMPPVQISLPDGTTIRSDDTTVHATLSALFDREVCLRRAAPDDFTIDQYHPDLGDLDPDGPRDTVTESRLGAALFAMVGIPSPVPSGSFLDVFPLSVMTTSTLAQLEALQPGTRFDESRFRMNVIVTGAGSGFVENAWVGQTLSIGNSARMTITMPDPRCVMTTLAQGDLVAEPEVLRTLARHNRLEVLGGRYPCAGVYASVGAAGTVRTGDAVSFVETT